MLKKVTKKYACGLYVFYTLLYRILLEDLKMSEGQYPLKPFPSSYVRGFWVVTRNTVGKSWFLCTTRYCLPIYWCWSFNMNSTLLTKIHKHNVERLVRPFRCYWNMIVHNSIVYTYILCIYSRNHYSTAPVKTRFCL